MQSNLKILCLSNPCSKLLLSLKYQIFNLLFKNHLNTVNFNRNSIRIKFQYSKKLSQKRFTKQLTCRQHKKAIIWDYTINNECIIWEGIIEKRIIDEIKNQKFFCKFFSIFFIFHEIFINFFSLINIFSFFVRNHKNFYYTVLSFVFYPNFVFDCFFV